jgi:hypothetical protein
MSYWTAYEIKMGSSTGYEDGADNTLETIFIFVVVLASNYI